MFSWRHTETGRISLPIFGSAIVSVPERTCTHPQDFGHGRKDVEGFRDLPDGKSEFHGNNSFLDHLGCEGRTDVDTEYPAAFFFGYDLHHPRVSPRMADFTMASILVLRVVTAIPARSAKSSVRPTQATCGVVKIAWGISLLLNGRSVPAMAFSAASEPPTGTGRPYDRDSGSRNHSFAIPPGRIKRGRRIRETCAATPRRAGVGCDP